MTLSISGAISLDRRAFIVAFTTPFSVNSMQLSSLGLDGSRWISLQSVQIACPQVLSTSVKTHSNSSDSFYRQCITSLSNCDLFIRRRTQHNLYLSVCSTEALAERNKSSLRGVPAEILTGIT